MLRKKEEWEKIYKDKRTPWDALTPEPYLVRLVKERVIKPCAAIDIGCGTGNEVIFLAKKRFAVTGVDISETAIQIAKKKAKSENVTCEFITSDILRTVLKKKFDFALDRACFHFLEPKDRPLYIKNLKGILNPEALYLLIVSSNKESPKGPYQFSKNDLIQLFSKDFDILSIKLITLKTHREKPKPYICLFEKK